MLRPMVSRLVFATLALGLTATPALAGKNKKKAKARKAAQAAAQEVGPAVAGAQPHLQSVPNGPRVYTPARPRPSTTPRPAHQPRAHATPGSRPLTSSGSLVQRPPRSTGGSLHGAQPATSWPRNPSSPLVEGRPDTRPRPAPGTRPAQSGPSQPAVAPASASGGKGKSKRKSKSKSKQRCNPNHKQPARTVRIEKSSWTPDGWVPRAHRYHLRCMDRNSFSFQAHGVYTFARPPKRDTVKIFEKNPSTGAVTRYRGPLRHVNRTSSLGVGVVAGSSIASELPGVEAGYGLVARIRTVEALGFEASWMRYGELAGEEHAYDTASLSGQLFAYPWSRVSPFVSAGATASGDLLGAGESYLAPHVGLGVELGIGDSIAFDLEARGVAMDGGAPASSSMLQGNAGVVVYF